MDHEIGHDRTVRTGAMVDERDRAARERCAPAATQAATAERESRPEAGSNSLFFLAPYRGRISNSLRRADSRRPGGACVRAGIPTDLLSGPGSPSAIGSGGLRSREPARRLARRGDEAYDESQ